MDSLKPNGRVKSADEKAATAASADAWRAQCERYRAQEAAQGVPTIPSDRVLEERLERHFDSANGSSHYAPRCCTKGNGERIVHRKAGY